jgi:hypothetical protein
MVIGILALGKLRQEDHEFKTSLGYRVRIYLKKINNEKPTTIVYIIK